MMQKRAKLLQGKVDVTYHSKISKEILKCYSTKLSLRGKDIKSKKKFSTKRDALTLLQITALFKCILKGPCTFEET